MKKNNKKGFTIVELVIVIAVIAILAAVLIPTFSSVIKKAKVNNDIQLVRNLNTALAADTKEHKTMQSALDAAFEFGYDVAKINNTSVEENEILWDSVNDVFCYLKDGALEYVPNSATTVLAVNDYRLWKISDTVDATYSTYYYKGSATTINTSKGFDAGTTTGITAINYTNNGSAQDVVIRTNGGKLTIDAENDTIHHYGDIENLKITAVDTNSYHEYGKVGFVSIAKGRFVSEANSKVIALLSTGADVVISQASQGSIVAAYTTVANNNSNGNTTLTLKAAYADENNTELKDIIYNAEAQVINAISVNGKYYKTMSEAFDKVVKVNGEGYALDGDVTITLYKDIVENGFVVGSGVKVIFDFNGYTYDINATVGSVNTTTNGFQLLKDATVTFKNGTLTSSKAQIMIQNYSNLTLDNMVLDGRNLAGWCPYALSNNNGNIVIKDTTIYAKAGGFAFDVCRYASYESVHVKVTGNSVIDGRIEISASNNNAAKGFSLTLENGDFTNTSIVVDSSAKNLINASNDAGTTNTITKSASVTIGAPSGFSWDSDGKLVKD